MGVPKLFRTLCEKFGTIVKPADQMPRPDVLCLDWNAILHPIAARVVAAIKRPDVPSKEEIERRVIETAISYIYHLLSTANPREMLYIAADGVAPMGKCHQQRQRRHKSARLTRLSDALAAEMGLPDRVSLFDSTCITPGTAFMAKMGAAVVDHFSRHDVGVTVVFSGADCPGEGEHKLMARVRADKDAGRTWAICGLDADLICLSLICGAPNVYLFRERVYFSNMSKNSLVDTPFADMEYDCLDVDELKRCVVRDARDRTGRVYDAEPLCRDTVFIFQLLGHDFLPHLPGLKIHTGGLDVVVGAYHAVLKKSERYLVGGDGGVDPRLLQELLASLAAGEEELVRRARRSHFTPKYHHDPAKTPAQNRYDKAVHEANLAPEEADDVRIGEPGWHHRYYAKYFGADPVNRAEEYAAIRRQAARAFLTGMAWTHRYYRGEQPDWAYFYPYEAAPLLCDIAGHAFDLDTVVFEKTKPLLPLQQLLLVLPVHCHGLLPPSYRGLRAIQHLYPTDFRSYGHGSAYYGDCVPRLPPTDAAAVVAAVKGLRLTPAERARNALGKEAVINHAG